MGTVRSTGRRPGDMLTQGVGWQTPAALSRRIHPADRTTHTYYPALVSSMRSGSPPIFTSAAVPSSDEDTISTASVSALM